MNLSSYYWYFESALTPKFCDDVISYALQQKEVLGRTGGYNKENLSKQDIKNIQLMFYVDDDDQDSIDFFNKE